MTSDDSRTTEVRAPLTPARGQGDGRPVLVAIRGPRCGQTFAVRPMAVLGRDEIADLAVGDLGVSRRHAVLVGEGERWSIEDLGSKNGTRVNGEQLRRRRELRDGDRISLGADTVLVFGRSDAAAEHIDRALMERARRDGLTGALSRPHFVQQLRRDFSSARRHDEPLSLLLLDLDRFKRVNDDFGHAAGDAVLMAVSAIVHSWIPSGNPIARFGGDEFAILCRGTSSYRAVGLASRVKRMTAEEHVRVGTGERVAITASIGVATYPGDRVATAFQLLAAAYRALDLAKARGGDRVAVLDEAPP